MEESSLCCRTCLTAPTQLYECGAGCEHEEAVYCSQQCAQKDWTLQHQVECEEIGRKEKWSKGIHLKRGSFSRYAKRHHHTPREMADILIHKHRSGHKMSEEERHHLHQALFMTNVRHKK